MDQLPIESPKRRNHGGGNQRTPDKRFESANREEQIVALRLRRVSFAAIGRTVGVSKAAAVKAFYRALRRNTDKDIQTHHRNEIAELEMEQARVWSTMDRLPNNPKIQLEGIRALNMIHKRRAALLGLDAPQKLDIRGFYGTGADEMSAERIERQAVLAALPLEEQARLHEIFNKAKRLAASSIPTTATVVNSGNDGTDDSDSDDETDGGAEQPQD